MTGRSEALGEGKLVLLYEHPSAPDFNVYPVWHEYRDPAQLKEMARLGCTEEWLEEHVLCKLDEGELWLATSEPGGLVDSDIMLAWCDLAFGANVQLTGYLTVVQKEVTSATCVPSDAIVSQAERLDKENEMSLARLGLLHARSPAELVRVTYQVQEQVAIGIPPRGSLNIPVPAEGDAARFPDMPALVAAVQYMSKCMHQTAPSCIRQFLDDILLAPEGRELWLAHRDGLITDFELCSATMQRSATMISYQNKVDEPSYTQYGSPALERAFKKALLKVDSPLSNVQEILDQASDFGLATLPDAAVQLLVDCGAPPSRLVAHLALVHDVACRLLDGLKAKLELVELDIEAVRFGAATHDIGKSIQRSELSGPGKVHEQLGQDHMSQWGIEARLSRFAVTHGLEPLNPSLDLGDMLVMLADSTLR